PPPVSLPRTPKEAPGWMRRPVEVLVLACLVVGIVPGLTIAPFLDSAVRSVLGPATPEYSLAIWHGFNAPLLLSLVALIGGTIGYLLFGTRLNRTKDAPLVRSVKAWRAFEGTLAAIISGARALMNRVGTQRLQAQLRVLVLIAMLAA